MKIPARIRLHMHRRDERKLLEGHVRECSQYSVKNDVEPYRWDFAYRDPASGFEQQYSCTAFACTAVQTPEQFHEMVREPALLRLAMMLQRKCGIKEAVAHKIQLPLPRAALVARYV